ncbi:hypothetical protein NP233_g7416 [Leucocoprinus birnbaumii]|uniref:F-box domain-containing protein n=1 Tax=Leucocoprinus birnbaumii TaxID=56174 RepID=A0AAD5YST3_9AGAR|nr:hypothetical protein NP233_g7416 [Leucocoprinus birnbaumii]
MFGKRVAQAKLDTQLDVIKEKIEDLWCQARLVRGKRNGLAPISVLPPDIFAEIFAICEICMALMVNTIVDGSDATHVCQSWREISHSFPGLWSVISDFTGRFDTIQVASMFHWGLYLAKDANTGWLIRATNHGNKPGDQTLRFERKKWNGRDSVTSVAFVKIGKVDMELGNDESLQYVKNIDLTKVPQVQQDRERVCDCRVWVKEAVCLLHRAILFVKCPHVDLLESRLKMIGAAAQYAQGNTKEKAWIVAINQNIAGAWDE